MSDKCVFCGTEGCFGPVENLCSSCYNKLAEAIGEKVKRKNLESITPIEKNAYLVLEKLVDKRDYVDAEKIHRLTGLAPNDINDAVEHLAYLGALSVHKAAGTAPFNFQFVEVKAKGRIMYQKLKEK